MVTLNLNNTDCSKIEVFKVNTSNYKENILKYAVNTAKKFGDITEANAKIVSYYDNINGNPYASAHLCLTFMNKVKVIIIFCMEYNSVGNIKTYIENTILLFINKKLFHEVSYEIKKTNEITCRFFGENIKIGKDLQKRKDILDKTYFVIEVTHQYTTVTKYENLIPNLEKIYHNIKRNHKEVNNIKLDKFIQYYIEMLMETFLNPYKIGRKYCGMELTITKAKFE